MPARLRRCLVCSSSGLAVLRSRAPVEADPFPPESFDAVWIPNCFEQLAEPPASTLDRVRRLLRPRGLLVLRTPTADFVSLAYRCPAPVGRLLLSGSNLTGVPYLRCYSEPALRQLLEGAGFTRIAARGRFPTSLAASAYGSTPLAIRSVRDPLFGLVSRLRRRLCFPWMDVTARRPPRRAPREP
jgi:SAM-dependent methyltransferase